MRWAILCLLVASCGSSPKSTIRLEPNPSHKSGSNSDVYVPLGPASDRYGGSDSNRQMDRFRSALSDRLTLKGDARLDRVADDLVELYALHQRIPAAAIEFLLQHYGVAEPSPEIVSIRTAASDEYEVARTVRESLKTATAERNPQRYGAATKPVSGGYAVVVVLQETPLRLRAVQKQLPEDGVIELRGELPAGYATPTLYRTLPGGAVEQPVVVQHGREFHAAFGCQTGRNQVELTGVGRFGITVLANFPVFCSVAPPAQLSLHFGQDDVTQSDGEVARTLFDLTNRERGTGGLEPFVWSPEAARVAGRHSADMRDADFVGHVSPTTGGPADRTRAEGVKVSLVLENVARAPSAKEAHSGLMNSPGHRANILSNEATHLGVGVRRRKNGELLVTQMFYRIPKPQDVAQARSQLVEKIELIRRAQKMPKWRVDETLEAVALRHAKKLARSRGRAKAPSPPMLLASRYRSIVTAVEVVGSPNDFVGKSVERPGRAGFGLGVSQGEHDELGANVLYVVVLIGIPH